MLVCTMMSLLTRLAFLLTLQSVDAWYSTISILGGLTCVLQRRWQAQISKILSLNLRLLTLGISWLREKYVDIFISPLQSRMMLTMSPGFLTLLISGHFLVSPSLSTLQKSAAMVDPQQNTVKPSITLTITIPRRRCFCLLSLAEDCTIISLLCPVIILRRSQ